jgi:PAS domain S-box-containing protein
MTDKQPVIPPELAQYALDRSHDSVFWITAEGRFCYVNDAACANLGYTRDELLRMSLTDIDPSLTAENWAAHWARTKARTSSLIEARHRRKDGTLTPVHVAVNYLQYEGREYHCSIARDLSVQKHDEQAIKEQDRMLRLLMVAAVSANEAVDVRQTLRHVIDQVCVTMEWPLGLAYLLNPDSPDTLELADVQHAEQAERYAEVLKRAAATKFTKGMAMIGGVFASGKPGVMQLTEDVDIDQYPIAGAAARVGLKSAMAFPIRVASEVVGVLVFASESPYFPDTQLMHVMGDIGTQLGRIIERKQSEVALQRSQASLALAQRIAHLGSWEWDLVKGTLIWSEEVYRIYNVSPATFVPTNEAFLELIPADERPMVRRAVLRAIEGEVPYDIEHQVIQPGGTIRTVREQAEVFHDQGGRPIKVAGSVQDITEMKEAQKEREALTRTLAAKNEELESIIYASSHDLRSPLVNIQGFSWELARDCGQVLIIIREGRLPAELMAQLEPILKDSMPANVQYINASVRKMDDLMRGLLRLSRLERDAVPASAIDANRMLAGIIDSMSYRIEQAGAQVVVEELPPCKGDAGQIAQVFSNLLDNALKYRAEGRATLVRISGHSEGKMQVYRVEDNGPGISAMHKEKVFEIFHRLDPTGPVAGEGLGLTIARRVVQRHGGSIRVESDEGKGTAFVFTLPA